MTHPQQDNPKGTKMRDKIDIDELIERLERCSPFGHSEPKKHRIVDNETFEKTITALTDMKVREDAHKLLIGGFLIEEKSTLPLAELRGWKFIEEHYTPEKRLAAYGEWEARQSKTNHKGDEL